MEAEEFNKTAQKASEGSYGLNLKNFPNVYDPSDVAQEAAAKLASVGLLETAGERLTRITIQRTSISMARKLQAQCRGYTRVFNECNLPKSLSGETHLTNASEQSHEKKVDDGEEMELLRKRIRAAMGVINQSDAQAVRMRFLEGKTVAQIAVELGTTRDTIDCRVRRGVRAIKAYREDIADGTSVE